MASKLIQLLGLVIVIVATVVFSAMLYFYSGQLTGPHSNDHALLSVAGTFLTGIGGIFLWLFGRAIAWWKRG